MLKSFRALLGSVLRCRGRYRGTSGTVLCLGPNYVVNARSLGATCACVKGATSCLQPVRSHFRSRQPLRKKAWLLSGDK